MADLTQIELPDGNTYDLKDSRLRYGTCTTAAGTQAKVATLANSEGFTLETGSTVHIKFTYSNTKASPTLNVNSTGAKSIKKYGTTAVGTSETTSWYAGSVVSFTYDGTNWIQNDYKEDSGDTNTWRNIKVNGTEILGTGTSTGALDLVAGNNVELSNSSGSVTFSASAGGSNIHVKSSGNGIKQYSLFARINDISYDETGDCYVNDSTNNCYSSFTTSSGTGTKTYEYNPTFLGWDFTKLYYYDNSSDLAVGSYNADNKIKTSANSIDLRYTFNISTNSLTANRPVYMILRAAYYVGGWQSTETPTYGYVSDIEELPKYTQNPVTTVLDLGLTGDSYSSLVFVYIGHAIDGYHCNLAEKNTAYRLIPGPWDSTDNDIPALYEIKDANNSLTYEDLRGSIPSTINILKAVYPVGSIYISTVSTNPQTLFGFGTWAAFGTGKTLVGIDTSDTDFNTVEKTGGSKTHSHYHNSVNRSFAKFTWSSTNKRLMMRELSLTNEEAYNENARVSISGTWSAQTAGTSTYGVEIGGWTDPASSLQPYITTYMWKRTA